MPEDGTDREHGTGGSVREGVVVDGGGLVDEQAPTSDVLADESDIEILLVEDNPGDARLIEELLREVDDVGRRLDPTAERGRSVSLRHESRLADGIDSIEDREVEIVLLDLDLPDSAGLDTLDAVLEVVTESVPVVVLTGLRDREHGIGAIRRGAQDYLVKDEVTRTSITRSIDHALVRKRQELAERQRRRRLESLNRLNRLSQDVTNAVIETASRSELENQVCERLVEADGYAFAWIGAVERGGGRIRPRAAAGEGEGYHEEITVTVDDRETAQGPAGRAVNDRRVHVVDDIAADSNFEPWRESALERGFNSSAAVPLTHEDVLYGVLNVYATEPKAFGAFERETLSRLGDIVGHAIAAIERKEALTSEVVIELELRIRGILEPLVEQTRRDEACSVTLDRLIDADGTRIGYGTASGLDVETLQSAIEEIEWIDAFRFVKQGAAEYVFEIAIGTDPGLFEVLGRHAGRIETAVVTGGEFRVVATAPRGADVRGIVEGIQDACPGAEFLAQRTVDRDVDPLPSYDDTLEGRLTEKQRIALETAYFAGHFDWPRTTTGEEVAERLGIAPATFNQHLRAAERKIFEAILDR